MAETSTSRGDEPASENLSERLRDAFAQLLLVHGTAGAQKMLAGGTAEAIPAESLWMAQGRQQFPPPAPPEGVTQVPAITGTDANRLKIDPERPQGYGPGDDVNIPTRVVSGDPYAKFPVLGEPKPGADEAPFGGKGRVVGPSDSGYKLPKKKDKKEGKG